MSDNDKPVPRVVVKFRDNIRLPYEDGAEKHIEKLKIESLGRLLREFPDITLKRLYTDISPDKLQALMEKASIADPTYHPPNLLTYFVIDCPEKVDPEALSKAFRALKIVESAYVEGGPTPPPVVNAADDPRSPDQGYLDPAPDGIDAEFAWTVDGGDGEGIEVVDMEQGWTLNHEDLEDAGITLISGINNAFFGHGTSVLGEIVAVDNTIGGVGIVPSVSCRVVSQQRTASRYNTAEAILSAVAELNFGDVLLLEAQTTVSGSTYLPVEVERAVFDAIRLGTATGIVIVEAGGNGSNDLDEFRDASGKHVLNRNSDDFKDSGAIMVGAASSAAPHSRLDFSNYGSRIDCYAWGENIDTTGDGWQGNLTNTYTSTFGGTSGASPIITGAAVAVEGMVQAARGYRFSPLQLRAILSNPDNGTASNDPDNDRIGVMPDLKAIYDNNFSGYPESSGPLPVLDLCNRETPNPVIGKGPLGKSDLYFTYREKDRDLLVVTLQKMLLALGYDLGKTGPKKDGVDGKFGDLTEKAVRKYQGDPELAPVDWEGNPLKVDGLVGPRTSDALNRHFVGSTTAGLTYYEVYQTPVKLTGESLFFTVSEKLIRKGLALDDVSDKTLIKLQMNPK